MYCYACETDQLQSRHLGIKPILDTMIMNAARCALSKEHHGKQLQRIAESWSLTNSNVVSPQDEYE